MDLRKVLSNNVLVDKTSCVKKTFVQVVLKVANGGTTPKTKINEPISHKQEPVCLRKPLLNCK